MAVPKQLHPRTLNNLKSTVALLHKQSPEPTTTILPGRVLVAKEAT